MKCYTSRKAQTQLVNNVVINNVPTDVTLDDIVFIC